MEKVRLSVSDFIALTNQTLEFAYPTVSIEGEVASFGVNQSKYVFFDLKDETGTINCFMMAWQLRLPIEDGMRVVITAAPRLTQKGRFSLTVRSVRPLGEGALKKSFELLKARLASEGLFDLERKRSLPELPQHIGVITSQQAAGYADFIKILDDRWSGIRVDVAQVQVQGEAAAKQIIRAIAYFNQAAHLPEVIVVLRGGGSADDLAVFNDEHLVRAIAASRVPILTGIGHEIDESLADLVADRRAATPSNAAQLLVPDKQELRRELRSRLRGVLERFSQRLGDEQRVVRGRLEAALMRIESRVNEATVGLEQLRRTLSQLDPNKILERGYAIVRGSPAVGARLQVETKDATLIVKVETYDKKSSINS